MKLADVGHVHSDELPSHDALGDVLVLLVEQDVAHDRVGELGLLAEVGVVFVLDEVLLVLAVALVLAHLLDELLVEEHLAGVGGDIVLDGVVGEGLGSGGVGHDMDVRGAAGVVAREVGAEPDGAVGVGLLEAAVEGLEGVVGVGVAGAVGVGDDAGVDAGGVRVYVMLVACF